MWMLLRETGVYGIRPAQLRRKTTNCVPPVGPLQGGFSAIPRRERKQIPVEMLNQIRVEPPIFRAATTVDIKNSTEAKAHQVHR